MSILSINLNILNFNELLYITNNSNKLWLISYIDNIYFIIFFKCILINLNNKYFIIFFNCTLINLIVYPVANNYNSLAKLKIDLLNSYYILMNMISDMLLILNNNFIYALSIFGKDWFINLLVRLIDIDKEKEERYLHRKKNIAWQFLDFYYIKIIFNYFFGLFFRILYYIIYFFFNNLIFIFKLLSLKLFMSLNINLFLYYIWYNIKNKLIFLGYWLLNKFNTLFYFLKLDFFIFLVNENNFFGGFIIYVYNAISYKIPSFNSPELWDTDQLLNIKIFDSIYNQIKNFNIFYYNINKHNFFVLVKLNILFIFNILIKFWLFLLNHFIINLRLIIKWFKTNRIIKYWIIKRYINYIFINLYFLINKVSIFLYINYNLGYLFYLFYDIIKYLIFYILIYLKFIIIRLKYIILLYIFFKLNIINLLSIYILSNIHFLVNHELYYILYNIYYVIYDYYEVMNLNLYNDYFNDKLIHIWHNEYKDMLFNKDLYYRNTLISKFLNWINVDLNIFSQWYKKKNIILSDYYYIKDNIKYKIKYIINTLKGELYLYYIIFKEYFIFTHIRIFFVYIFRLSDLNLYYYLFKKITLIMYILYIYIYSYFKFLYLYILPCYYDIPLTYIYYYYCIYWKILYNIKYYSIFYIFYIYNIISILFFYIIVITYFLINLMRYIIKFINIATFYMYILLKDCTVSFKYNSYLIMYNFLDIFLFIFINWLLVINKCKEFFINYFRLDILNLIDYNTKYSILGNNAKGFMVFDMDSIDMERLKKSKIKLKMADFEKLSKLGPIISKFDEYFFFNSKLYKSNVYQLIFMYYEKLNIESNFFSYNNIILFKIYIKNIIFYYFMKNYILIYLVIYYFISYSVRLNEPTKIKNLNHLWYNFKTKFNYKLLNNNKLFIKALDFLQKKNNKKKKLIDHIIYLNLYLIIIIKLKFIF